LPDHIEHREQLHPHPRIFTVHHPQLHQSYFASRKPTQAHKEQGPSEAGKMDIRVLRPSDIPHVQLANITNLPENYFCKYYLYHAMSWPQLSYVAVDVSVHSTTFASKILDLHITGKREDDALAAGVLETR
jgi:hypothetical protein